MSKTIDEIQTDLKIAKSLGRTSQVTEFYYELQDAQDRMARWWRDLKPERQEQIMNAERDGRCIILPCKVGDTWFNIYDGKINEIVIDAVKIGQVTIIYFNDRLYPGETFNVPEWRFKEICHPTRESAEAALKGE